MSAYAVTRAYHFSAAHRLANDAFSDAENAEVYGQCFRQHGHNYLLEVLDRVDHYDLSATVPALAGVITTGENLARTFWEWLEGALPPGSLRRVTLVETANNVFEYCGEPVPGEVTGHGR